MQMMFIVKPMEFKQLQINQEQSELQTYMDCFPEISKGR